MAFAVVVLQRVQASEWDGIVFGGAAMSGSEILAQQSNRSTSSRVESESRWRKDLQFAVDLAHQAGELAFSYFTRGIEFSKKDDDSPITVADRECEALIRGKIAKLHPSDNLLGEEEGETKPSGSGRKWIIDPIDGTYNFARGVPTWSVLLALEEDGDIVAGVVHNPAANETYSASRGGGSFKNGRSIHVSTIKTLQDSYLLFGEHARILEHNLFDGFSRLVRATYKHRGFGDYLTFGYVFEGKAELGLEVGVKPWDLAPMRIIVEEAGGRFTDLQGNPDIYPGTALVSNAIVHEAALKLLTGS